MTDHTQDAPLAGFNGGRYAQGAGGLAPMWMRHPCICVDVASMPTPPPPDPGVEGFSGLVLPNHIHLATGGCPVWIEVSVDDAGVRTETYFYRDKTTGASVMTTGNAVGANPAASLKQLVGNYHKDYIGAATVTAADIIADAIAAGVVLHDGLGANQAAVAADFISRIDVDLKPIGGHGSDQAGGQVTATASDAQFTDGAGVTDIDPGGSRSIGANMANGFIVPTNFVEFTIPAGAIVTVAVDIATVPA